MIYEGIRQYIQYVSKNKLRTVPFKESVLRPKAQSIEIPVKRLTTGFHFNQIQKFSIIKTL
jgi:hypothetical protein